MRSGLPAPLIFLASVVFGLLLHWLFPLGLELGIFGIIVGAASILGAMVPLIAAMRTFRAAGTPVLGNRPSTTVVRHGPYRFSRNPIYLAFSLLQTGIALCVSSL